MNVFMMSDSDKSEAFIFQPTIVIHLASHIASSAKEWLVKRIRNEKQKNGCQLNVDIDNDLLFISATRSRLLFGAELLCLKKKYKDGSIREFSVEDGKNFQDFEDDDFLSESECYRIMKSELDGLRAMNESSIPGHLDIKLYPGKSIFCRMTSQRLITDCFPLHNRKTLHKLRLKWYKCYDAAMPEPLGDIREYFGDMIAVYFAFLNYYTSALVPMLAISILSGLFFVTAFPNCNWAFAVINVVWSGMLLKTWKRKSTEYAYEWGSLGVEEWEEPRSGYRGELSVNEITNNQEPFYPAWKRNLKIYFVSFPILGACIGAAVGIMYYYFSWETYLMEKYKDDNSLFGELKKNIPSIIYCIVIFAADQAYRKLAYTLTDMENHRLESSFQNHLITKILLFDFVNNFLSLFYIAFIYNDMDMLRMTLRNLFVGQMLVSQALESLFPYFQYKERSVAYLRNHHPNHVMSSHAFEKLDLSREEHVDLELQRDTYEDSLDDYLELWLQFGYVVLFASIYPHAAIFAFLNNLIETRSDAFKLCNVYRRPFAQQASGIGAWQMAFEILSYLSIATNLALILRTNSLFSQQNSSLAYTLAVFIVLEHVFLMLRWLVSETVPDIPMWVWVETGKLHYRSMQALKLRKSLRLPAPPLTSSAPSSQSL